MKEFDKEEYIEQGGLYVDDGCIWYEGIKYLQERTCRLVRHDGCKSNGWWTCSECGARINGHPMSNPDKYCGRCGAKVVER